LYVDECVEGVIRFMNSDFCGPVNIGSEEMISINDLALMVIGISKKTLGINNIKGPEGVRGRNSDNNLFRKNIGWESTATLYDGISKTYQWVENRVQNSIVCK
jgi:nucleoside-diphosphate-sugar epimerase